MDLKIKCDLEKLNVFQTELQKVWSFFAQKLCEKE